MIKIDDKKVIGLGMGFAFRTTDIGIPVDSPNLMLLFYVAQLFLRELCKSKNLIRIVPMDMTEYYGNFHNPPINPHILGIKHFH